MANPSSRSRNRRSVTEPLLRHVPPIPIEDDDNDNQDSRDSEEYCTHLGQRLQRFSSLPSKISAVLFSYMVLGLIISTPGVILPHLEAHYRLNDIKVSLIFLVAPLGYFVGASLNTPIHRHLGQRGIAVIAPAFQAVFMILAAAVHMPERQIGFAVFLVATPICSIGNGIVDGSWAAWVGGLGGDRTNTVQGLLHGAFSIGAGLGPFLAETMFSMGKQPWWTWYYVLLGAVILQAIVLYLAFRFEDADRYRADVDRARAGVYGGIGAREPIPSRIMFTYIATWICAVYFLVYVGTESAISGWVITFMLRVRHASPYLASFSSSGFWIGMAAGRLALGLVTDKLGVRRATAAYLTIAIISQALLATIDVAAVSIALITLIGFFLGPLFPSGVVILAQLLPKQLLVGAVSFAASVGQLGAAVSPFLLGSLAQALGIYVFQVFILAMLAVTLLVWVLFPAKPRSSAGPVAQ